MQSNKIVLALALSLTATSLFAQRNRINVAVNRNQRVLLNGHVHPRALAEDDQGRVDGSMVLPRVTILLRPSAGQQADLDRLLAQQQDPSSPQYHHWLTSDDYAVRFGMSQDDIAKIVGWLTSENLTVLDTARAHNSVTVRGTAAQVESAFGIQLHHYLVDGQMHFANTTEPAIPAALAPVIGSIHGLHDFRMKAPRHSPRVLTPDYTTSKGNHYLAPDDLATIYNMKALYNAGVDGSGQQVVVVGQTAINTADLLQFRTQYSLPGNDPQIVLVPGSPDPGILKSELLEADLDIEWSSAVARNANITFVYAQDVMDAVQYSIDNNLAPVINMSYGLCEAQTPASDAASMESWGKQANAQGISWFAASGDSGATDCWDGTSKTPSVMGVDLPAALPEVTGVGGSTFNEGSGVFWNTANDPNSASVLSYIPEMAWNDSNVDGGPSSSGGGASMYFQKPSWQTGAGVPSDNVRAVPDVSLPASADHDGYLVYSGGSLQVVGGTSVSAQVFGSLAALINHAIASSGGQAGLGNINPRLYSLAQTNPSVFHDITTGNNIINVTCTARARNCTPGSVGYDAGPGYDQVTGLGTVDAYNLVSIWAGNISSVQRGSTAMSLTAAASALTVADRAVLTATVTSTNGGTPQGSVSFNLGSALLGTATLAGSAGTATATLTVDAAQLALGSDTITAQYGGDTAYNGSTGSVVLTVTSPASGPPAITGVSHAASFVQSFAPGMILSIFGSQLAPVTASAATVPLPGQLAGVSVTINGITAPLYYVSAGQLNVQIPYETPANGTALVVVSNAGKTANRSFTVASVAPGIFTNANHAPVPSTSASRGQTVTLYITGAGAVTPAVGTGAAPASGTPIASLPHPSQSVTLSVGGTNAPIQFVGIPAGLVGVVQINYQVPAGIATGTQQVIVSIGGVSSAPATLTVN